MILEFLLTKIDMRGRFYRSGDEVRGKRFPFQSILPAFSDADKGWCLFASRMLAMRIGDRGTDQFLFWAYMTIEAFSITFALR